MDSTSVQRLGETFLVRKGDRVAVEVSQWKFERQKPMTNKKLKELILYLASESREDNTFGATKLNKLLFLIDFQAYALWGTSVTNAKYIRRQFGPVPKDLLIARDELRNEGRLDIEERERFGKVLKRIVPLKNPDLSLFSKDELDLVKEVLNECERLNGTELSDWTHTLRPYLDAEDGEEIPYFTTFVLKDVPISQSDITWGQSRVAELRALEYAI